MKFIKVLTLSFLFLFPPMSFNLASEETQGVKVEKKEEKFKNCLEFYKDGVESELIGTSVGVIVLGGISAGMIAGAVFIPYVTIPLLGIIGGPLGFFGAIGGITSLWMAYSGVTGYFDKKATKETIEEAISFPYVETKEVKGQFEPFIKDRSAKNMSIMKDFSKYKRLNQLYENFYQNEYGLFLKTTEYLSMVGSIQKFNTNLECQELKYDYSQFSRAIKRWTDPIRE